MHEWERMEAPRPDFVFDGRWHNLISVTPGMLLPDSRCSRTFNSFFFSFRKKKCPWQSPWLESNSEKRDWQCGGSTASLPPAVALLHISYQPPCFCVAHLKLWHQNFTALNMYMHVYSFFSARFVFLLFLSLFRFGVRHGKVNLACIAHQKQPCLPAAVPKPSLWELGCCHMLKLFIRILIDRNMII